VPPPPPSPPPPPPPRRRRRFRRPWVAAGLALCAAGTAALAALALTRATPAWWRPIDPADPATIDAAQAVEHAVVRQLSALRPAASPPATPDASWRSETWSVSLSQADANAWLAARLPRWLESREKRVLWPAGVREVRVGFGDGVVRLGVRLAADGREQIAVAHVAPDLRADGSLWLPASWFSIGRLPVPGAWALGGADPGDYLPADLARLPQVRRLADVLGGAAPLVNAAVIRLEDGRRVRLLRIAAREGRLELTCRTEKR